MDNIFASLFRFKQREATPQAITPGVPTSTNEHPSAKGGSFEERVVVARSPQVALTVSAVYRAVELRAKTIGQMVMQYQTKDSEKGNFVPSMWGPGKKLNYLLQVEPNPIMSASSLWEQATINRLMMGNGFVYIERDYYGEVQHLWLASCGGYNPERGTYVIAYMDANRPVVKSEVPRQDVLHLANTFRYQNGFWGVSTLQYAFETLTTIKTQKAQTLETAAKGGRMKLIIGEDTSRTVSPIAAGLFDKAQMEAYADEVNQRIYQKDVIALRALDKVQNISMSAQDMQMIEQMNLGLDDTARFFGTPRPLLMLDTNSHYNDYQNATMEYLQRTIAPDARDIEDECFRKFLNVNDFGKRRIHLCELPLLRMDLERQAKVDQLHLQMGWTVNEIRNQYDMPAIENGDIPYVSTNLAELGSAKLRENGSGRPTEQPVDESKPEA